MCGWYMVVSDVWCSSVIRCVLSAVRSVCCVLVRFALCCLRSAGLACFLCVACCLCCVFSVM